MLELFEQPPFRTAEHTLPYIWAETKPIEKTLSTGFFKKVLVFFGTSDYFSPFSTCSTQQVPGEKIDPREFFLVSGVILVKAVYTGVAVGMDEPALSKGDGDVGDLLEAPVEGVETYRRGEPEGDHEPNTILFHEGVGVAVSPGKCRAGSDKGHL